MRTAFHGTTFIVLLSVLLAAFLIQNVILQRQNHRLKATPTLPPIESLAVSPGKVLHEIGGVGLDGRYRSISLPNSSNDKLLLLTFAPGCPGCRDNQPALEVLTEQARKHGWRTVWVSRESVESTEKYCQTNTIPNSETVATPPYSTYIQLGMTAVPQVITVGPGGIVEHVWIGRLDKDTAAHISNYLSQGDLGTSGAVSVPAFKEEFQSTGGF
jgi:peroxiredoxin